ncbi:MAG: hypothetical protein DRJ05_09040, partial [Bacteroidetes bacterium]
MLPKIEKAVFIISFIIAGLILIESLQSQNTGINKYNGSEKIKELIRMAELHLDNKLDTSLVFGKQAIKLSIEQDFPKYQYQAAKIVADAWFYKDSLSKAIDYYIMAADIIKKIKGENSEEYASRISDI